MKKFIGIIAPVKAMAAGIFGGLMCLYMVSGILYARVTGEAFNYAIPFVFVIQGLVLSMLISVLWGIFLSDAIVKKWRYFKRHILFELSLLALLAICFLMFLAIPVEWSKIWLVSAGIITFGVLIIFGLMEMYLKKTGKRYTEILKNYVADNLK